MNRLAVENKLARIHWNATLALELIQYGFKDENLQPMRRYLNNILAASPSQATRNLNHIPDPIDLPDTVNLMDPIFDDDRGDEEKEAAKEPDGSEGYDADALGNEALMDDTYVPGKPDADCPF